VVEPRLNMGFAGVMAGAVEVAPWVDGAVVFLFPKREAPCEAKRPPAGAVDVVAGVFVFCA
jgi:hypothetical protein